MREDFVGGELQVGEGLDSGAQTPHGGGGLQAVSGHIPDDESDPQGRQGDDVEPVAADLGSAARGQVNARCLRRRGLGQGRRKQTSLQRGVGTVLTGVAAGVVHAERGPGADLRQQSRLLRVEGLAPPGAPDLDGSEQQTSREQGGQRHRMSVLGDPQLDQLWVPERGDHLGTVDHHGLAPLDAAQGGHVRERWHCHARRKEIGRPLPGGTGHRDPAQVQLPAPGDLRGFVAFEYCLSASHRCEVTEGGYENVHQFLSRAADVEGSADAEGCLVEQIQVPVGPLLAGDVDERRGDSRRLSLFILQQDGGHQQGPLPFRAEWGTHPLLPPRDGYTGLQRLAQRRLSGFGVLGGHPLRHPAAGWQRRSTGQSGIEVGPYNLQLRVVERDSDQVLGQQRAQQSSPLQLVRRGRGGNRQDEEVGVGIQPRNLEGDIDGAARPVPNLRLAAHRNPRPGGGPRGRAEGVVEQGPDRTAADFLRRTPEEFLCSAGPAEYGSLLIEHGGRQGAEGGTVAVAFVCERAHRVPP